MRRLEKPANVRGALVTCLVKSLSRVVEGTMRAYRVYHHMLRQLVLLLTLWAPSAFAGPAGEPAPTGSTAPIEEFVDDASPRTTLARYLELCRTGRYADAAHYLDVPRTQAARGPLLARRLKSVLDRHVWLDLESISPLATGNLTDGLPSQLEQIAQVPGRSGRLEPVKLSRRAQSGSEPAWVFSRATIERVDSWYETMDRRWAFEHLPLWMQRPGPKELLVWQWIALLPLTVLAWGFGALLSRITHRIFVKTASRTEATWDDAVVGRLRSPTTLLWTIGLLWLALPLLSLYKPANEFLSGLLKGCVYFTGLWIVSRVIEVWGSLVGSSQWAKDHVTAKSLVPIAVRLAKILVLIVAVVAFLSAMGYPAASLIAGLGVGGLAVALAAQKTIENLFGAFTLGLDQPFNVGDFVKIEDFVGTVESIGLRSTKIRTLDRTVISIANGKLAEMRIENFTARDRIRLACVLGLTYESTSEQLRQVLLGLEGVLRGHPKIWPDAVVVRFKEYADCALLIEVMAWFETTDFGEFQRIREEVLLEFMHVVHDAKASFAFPTRTLHVVQTPQLAQALPVPR